MLQGLIFLRDLWLPPSCGACGVVVARDRSFRWPCWRTLRWITDPRCTHCGEPLRERHRGNAEGRCLACQLNPPPWRSARAPWAYTGPARAMILRLKGGFRPQLAGHALGPLRHAAQTYATDPPLVIPVPLHRGRLWRRGYNQAALLAQGFAQAQGWDCWRDGLVRTRATAQSSGLRARERQRNVASAFAAPQPARLKGRGILLIDDVLTSGATAAACTTALLRAGAAYVDILTLPRVVRHPHASDIRGLRDDPS